MVWVMAPESRYRDSVAPNMANTNNNNSSSNNHNHNHNNNLQPAAAYPSAPRTDVSAL